MAALTKDIISNPALWRLSLLFEPGQVHVVLNNRHEDHALIYRQLSMDQSMSPLAAVEDIIYDNPLLLSDFEQVDVLVDVPRFTLVPCDIKGDDVQADIVSALWREPGLSVLANDLPTGDTLLMALETPMVSFLRRTFLDAEILHPMSVLVSYFAPLSLKGNSAKLYCRLGDGRIDLVGFSHGRLCIANTMHVQSAADMAYYILATAKVYDLDMNKDEVHLFGAPAMRDDVAQRLRQYARYVMPVIIPTAIFKAGKEALDAPFELAVMPLLPQ